MLERLTPVNWHARFQQQANWSKPLREFLYQQVKIQNAHRVLDVGCGTGVITADLHENTQALCFGLDIDPNLLSLAKSLDLRSTYIQADALRLPFVNDCFNISCCHFFLLWLKQPMQALAEMRRVTINGGWVLALAEPDYGGRIDYPAPLQELGRLQIDALRRQGADPFTGRKLAGWFTQLGFRNIQSGILGAQWNFPPSQESIHSEWFTLQADLAGIISPKQLDELHSIDSQAWQAGSRVLFVPTFYAAGQVA